MISPKDPTPELSTIKQALSDASKTTPTGPLLHEEIANLKVNRNLKKSYAVWFFLVLIVQLLVMNVVFFLVGFGFMKFDTASLNLYMGGTLAQVFGVIIVITKNLFPNDKEE